MQIENLVELLGILRNKLQFSKIPATLFNSSYDSRDYKNQIACEQNIVAIIYLSTDAGDFISCNIITMETTNEINEPSLTLINILFSCS